MLFNEIDPYCLKWLPKLFPGATVDGRSICDLRAADIAGHGRIHLFAGLGGWELALRIAGWPESWPVLTGSAPCQPFSTAGKRKGTEDERHLWPEMLRLIRECRPGVVLGEQVAGAGGLGWFDGVQAEMEACGYACWAVDLPAVCVGAPQKRNRLWWVAVRDGWRGGPVGDSVSPGLEGRQEQPARTQRQAVERTGDAAGPVGCTKKPSLSGRETAGRSRGAEGEGRGMLESARTGVAGVLGGTDSPRRTETVRRGGIDERNEPEPGCADSPWGDYRIIPCSDGSARRVGSGVQPVAHGIPRDVGPLLTRLVELGHDPRTARAIIRRARRNRVGRLRAYGNSIVPAVAALFVRVVMEYLEG